MTTRDWTLGGRGWEDAGRQRRAARRAEIVTEALAASSAGDIGALRLGLAEIVAVQEGVRSYSGGCGCAGKNSCHGHVPEAAKIARRALGLPALPDTERVETPDA